MSNNVIWAGPRLLVPITVEALVVTSAGNATQFSVQPLQLNQYSKYGLINPNLFVDTGMPKTPGVYLNWALPDGMTQGIKPKDGGPVQYPYLPNRWLIIRYSPNNTAPTASWIVESDYLFSQPPADDRPVQSPYISANENQEAQVSIIGNVYDFNGWTEQGQNTPMFLNAVGNSDLMFTAYAGNNSFVFSFLDAFTENTPAEVSYLVCGWCANVEYDILYNVAQPSVQGWTTEQDWLDLMTLLQWSVGSEAIDKNTDLDNAMTAAANWLQAQGITPPTGLPGTLAAQTLCHGLVFDVTWPGVNAEPPSNVPVFNPQNPQTVPYIAAANSSADCMAAFMQWQLNYNNPNPDGKDGDVEMMLEAFSHKMLPQPGGVIDTLDLMNAIHSLWFGHLPGGTAWVVQTQSKETAVPPVNPNEAPNTQAPASLTPQLAAQLAALNAQQAKFDADCRTLSSWQGLLYADWMKLNICKNAIGGCSISQKLNDAITADIAAINALITQLTGDVSTLNADIAALTAALSTSNLVLQDNPANKFFMPNDPAFMVNNIHRSYKRGEDIIYSKDDNYLFVRFTGQFITSLQVNTGSSQVIVNGSDIAPQFTPNNQIPTEIPALLAEAALLDVGFAAAIAQKATGQTNPPQNIINTVQQQQTLVWNAALDSSLDQQTLEQIPGFNPGDTLFHIPSKIGVWQWEQPWNPLHLEWEVNFFQANDMSDWQFDGFDYSWTAGPNLPLTNGYTLKGRSLLTPKEAVTLQSQLTEFINSYPLGKLPSDYIPLNDILNGVGDWDVLSQTIKGFMMQFLQWDIQQFGYLPTGEPIIADAMGYNPLDPSQPQISGYGMPLALPSDVFSPLLAGFVQILSLWVVDDFGQVYNINPATGNNPPNPKQPIPGIGFEPPGYTLGEQLPVCFQLPPRVIQASRLNFNLVSAKNDSDLSGQDTATTPISGWLLPNHIDGSVSVYDNTGLILGEIGLVGATGNQHAQWQPAPITGVDAVNIPNAHLKGFVQGILGNATGNKGTTPWSGTALANFLTVIDETLWSVDPLGERSNQSLSVLIGRPIAVVRASLQLELYGNPATNLSFAKTSGQDNGGIGNYTFDTQVGNIGLANDGVMGYFNDNDYSQFNSVHYGLVNTPDNPPYVVNNYLPLQFLAEAPSYVTILLDPRGSIHLSTGILPVLEAILPDLYVGKVMNNMLLEFDCGPLIMDNQTWKVPLPAGAGLNWSWMQPSQANNQLAYTEITSLVPANASVDWPINPPTILEGKLKLVGALGSQPAVYFFGVNNFQATGDNPPVYTIPAGTVPQLSWAGQGASATLTIGNATPVSVPLNSSGFALSGTGKQTVTLTVTDSKGANQQKTTITVITTT